MIENELIHLTIKDLLSLIDNPSDSFQRERRWLNENTSIGNWGYILPIAIANQIFDKDRHGQVMRILTYTPKIFGIQTTITVGITPFGLQQSGELRRLAQQSMAPLHSAKTQRLIDIEACAQIIDTLKKRLHLSKSTADAIINLVEIMAKQCDYNPQEFKIAVDKLLSGIE
jgi:hypothetical protein